MAMQMQLANMPLGTAGIFDQNWGGQPNFWPPGNNRAQRSTEPASKTKTKGGKSRDNTEAEEQKPEKKPLTGEERNEFENRLLSDPTQILALSKDPRSSFWTQQKIQDNKLTNEQRETLIQPLKGNYKDLAKCPHGNHVLQIILEEATPELIGKIMKEIISDESGNLEEGAIAKLAKHKFGC